MSETFQKKKKKKEKLQRNNNKLSKLSASYFAKYSKLSFVPSHKVKIDLLISKLSYDKVREQI